MTFMANWDRFGDTDLDSVKLTEMKNLSVSVHEWGAKNRGNIHSMKGNKKRKFLGAEFTRN